MAFLAWLAFHSTSSKWTNLLKGWFCTRASLSSDWNRGVGRNETGEEFALIQFPRLERWESYALFYVFFTVSLVAREPRAYAVLGVLRPLRTLGLHLPYRT